MQWESFSINICKFRGASSSSCCLNCYDCNLCHQTGGEKSVNGRFSPPNGSLFDSRKGIRVRKFKLGLIQMDLAFLDKEANLRKASEMVREAAANGASLICLPEAFNTGYLGSDIPAMKKMAEPL